jgi:hypothetical protein
MHDFAPTNLLLENLKKDFWWMVGKPSLAGLWKVCPSSVQNSGDGQLVTNMELGMAQWNS